MSLDFGDVVLRQLQEGMGFKMKFSFNPVMDRDIEVSVEIGKVHNPGGRPLREEAVILHVGNGARVHLSGNDAEVLASEIMRFAKRFQGVHNDKL